ncbi:hypothetical protein BaRGS_00014328 [Batillaria attramentaria]|uniref:Uncharacterized protein n=1 Tax=Batillaria attramentaria TaxID=370345 RepID=A0ABD0L5B5_9CAEN
MNILMTEVTVEYFSLFLHTTKRRKQRNWRVNQNTNSQTHVIPAHQSTVISGTALCMPSYVDSTPKYQHYNAGSKIKFLSAVVDQLCTA